MGRAQPHAAVNALPDHRAIWDPRTLAPGFFSLSTTLRPSAEALVGRAGIRDQGSSGVRTRNRRNGDCCGLRFFELNARARRAPFLSHAASGRLRPYWGAWLGRRSAGTEFGHGHGHGHCLHYRDDLACPFPARHHACTKQR